MGIYSTFLHNWTTLYKIEELMQCNHKAKYMKILITMSFALKQRFIIKCATQAWKYRTFSYLLLKVISCGFKRTLIIFLMLWPHWLLILFMSLKLYFLFVCLFVPGFQTSANI